MRLGPQWGRAASGLGDLPLKIAPPVRLHLHEDGECVAVEQVQLPPLSRPLLVPAQRVHQWRIAQGERIFHNAPLPHPGRAVVVAAPLSQPALAAGDTGGPAGLC